MASASSSELCIMCQTHLGEQKSKPGILFCVGCQKYFCSQHIVQHRQHLADLFENVVMNKSNQLQQKISTFDEQHCSDNIKTQLEIINKWEFDTIELIKQLATCVRRQPQEMALEECDKLKKQFSIISTELNTLRENENYFENDINQLIDKFQQLKHDIEHFPIEININEISRELISVKKIVPSAAPLIEPCYFIDKLLTSQKT